MRKQFFFLSIVVLIPAVTNAFTLLHPGMSYVWSDPCTEKAHFMFMVPEVLYNEWSIIPLEINGVSIPIPKTAVETVYILDANNSPFSTGIWTTEAQFSVQYSGLNRPYNGLRYSPGLFVCDDGVAKLDDGRNFIITFELPLTQVPTDQLFQYGLFDECSIVEDVSDCPNFHYWIATIDNCVVRRGGILGTGSGWGYWGGFYDLTYNYSPWPAGRIKDAQYEIEYRPFPNPSLVQPFCMEYANIGYGFLSSECPKCTKQQCFSCTEFTRLVGGLYGSQLIAVSNGQFIDLSLVSMPYFVNSFKAADYQQLVTALFNHVTDNNYSLLEMKSFQSSCELNYEDFIGYRVVLESPIQCCDVVEGAEEQLQDIITLQGNSVASAENLSAYEATSSGSTSSNFTTQVGSSTQTLLDGCDTYTVESYAIDYQAHFSHRVQFLQQNGNLKICQEAYDPPLPFDADCHYCTPCTPN